MATCEWFARCTRPAAGDVEHPVLGDVPVCFPCADRFRLIFTHQDPDDFDPSPCCPDPGCTRNPCTFPGYADNH